MTTLVKTPSVFAEQARLTPEQYQQTYQYSIDNPELFWREQASCIDWIKPFGQVSDVSFDSNDFHIRWYADGTLNVAANCLDRHAARHPDKPAIIWEGDQPDVQRIITYRELLQQTSRLANVLRQQGVAAGDRVTIYMPMIPEAAIAMLACARIGAVHSVVFGGFSAESLASRIEDCQSTLIITADEGRRGGRTVPLKAQVDAALGKAGTSSVSTVLVVQHTGLTIPMQSGRDAWYHDLMQQASDVCPAQAFSAEHPLFILYTSGSTGKPKGVLHTSGGYLVYVTSTFNTLFDLRDDDVFWCTADLGWITGHSYVLYGALSNGATTVMFEGVPQYPDWARVGQIIDKHQVTILYTAPTAIRAMMREGDAFVHQSQRSSLRLLGSVGEPINPEAWNWYFTVYGQSRCPIVDTWWQTETGGVLMAPYPNSGDMAPGAAMRPAYGITAAIVDQDGTPQAGSCEGPLVITCSWPGQARSLWGDHERFITSYFSVFPGSYGTGDGARRDAQGYYWITGRMDDVLNVSGHRLSTAEIESALGVHPAVAEAAVVGLPHDLKGQGIGAFIMLQAGEQESVELIQTLIRQVRDIIGPIATPDHLWIVPGLPKTRSGKIMRRILRKIAANEPGDLGDLSTLAEPELIDQIRLIRNPEANNGH